VLIAPGRGARLLDSPLGWTAVSRALLLQGFLLPFLMLSFFGSVWFLIQPELAPYLRAGELATFTTLIGALTLYGTILFAVGLYLRGHQPHSMLYQFLVAIFACLWPIAAGYYYGLHISGMVAAFLATSVLAVVLLDRWVAMVGVFAGVLGAVLISGLEQARVVRHAPLLRSAPFDASHLEHSWFWGIGVSVFLSALLVIFLVDQLVRKERAYARLLRELAVTDALTGAANRRHFIDALERELQRAGRFGFPVSVVLLDIDHFKRVNDSFGHPAGDEVLVQVVARLAAKLRESDLLARYGGEEFVVLLSHLGAVEARDAADRLRAVVSEEPLQVEGQRIPVTASFGVATVEPGETVGGRELLRRADSAMYWAKRAGRDRVCAWSQEREGGQQESDTLVLDSGG
jgi:diguanylate cyclase (GGDEF)-like protein